MPEMPAFVANLLEPRFARPTHVVSVVDIASSLRRVRLEADTLKGVSFKRSVRVTPYWADGKRGL